MLVWYIPPGMDLAHQIHLPKQWEGKKEVGKMEKRYERQYYFSFNSCCLILLTPLYFLFCRLKSCFVWNQPVKVSHLPDVQLSKTLSKDFWKVTSWRTSISPAIQIEVWTCWIFWSNTVCSFSKSVFIPVWDKELDFKWSSQLRLFCEWCTEEWKNCPVWGAMPLEVALT